MDERVESERGNGQDNKRRIPSLGVNESAATLRSDAPVADTILGDRPVVDGAVTDDGTSPNDIPICHQAPRRRCSRPEHQPEHPPETRETANSLILVVGRSITGSG